MREFGLQFVSTRISACTKRDMAATYLVRVREFGLQFVSARISACTKRDMAVTYLLGISRCA